MSILSGFTNQFKKPISRWVKIVAVKHIADYGKIEDLSIDFNEKSICCSLILNGEVEAITVEVKGFKVVKNMSKNYLTFQSVRLSREWMNTLADRFLPVFIQKNPLELPNNIALMLKLIL